MKKMVVLTSMILALTVSICGCGENQSDGSNYSFDYSMIGHPETLDPQSASDSCSLTVIGNLYTGLLEKDMNGKIVNAAAESYTVSSDGLNYNFKIRNNCFWFFDENKDDEVSRNECFNVTAYDFEFAFRRIFNPETCSPHKETYACIKNAQAIIDGEADYDQIGVHALSDTELAIELDYESADFLNSLTLTPAMPCNEEFFYNTKGRYGLDDQSLISNGAFFVRQWFYDKYGHDNFIYMQRNLINSDYNKIYPTSLNFYMRENYEEAKNDFENGSSDVLISFNCSEKIKEEYNINKYDNYTIGFIFNPEDKIYSNLNIRKALAYGIDKNSFDGQISEDLTKAYGIIPPGVTINNKSYRKLNLDQYAYRSLIDDSPIEYNTELASLYYDEGMKQMSLKSLTNIKLLVPESLMNTEYLHLVTQNWQKLFGFYIGIEEVPSYEFYNRLENNDYTIAVYPLTADYNSPTAFIEKFISNNNVLGYGNAYVDSLIKKLDKCENFEDSLNDYLEAEKNILNDYWFIPVFYKSEYEIMGTGNKDIIYDPFTKQLFFRYAKYFE